MPMNPVSNTGLQLGQMLLGTPQDNSGESFMKGQLIGSEVGSRMASAANQRAQAMINQGRVDARAQITPQAMQAAGYGPALAQLGAAVLGANAVPNLGQLGKVQVPGSGQDYADADAALRAGDLAHGNDLLIAAQGKPVKLTQLQEGQAFNPYATSDQHVNLTALGKASVADKNASATDKLAGAADKHASAGEHDARTTLINTQNAAGGFAPSHAGTAPSVAPVTALGTLLGGKPDLSGRPIIPPAQMRGFLAWQATKALSDPKYNNGAYALQQYALQAPLGSGIADTPADTGALDLGTVTHGTLVAPTAAAPATAAPSLGAASAPAVVAPAPAAPAPAPVASKKTKAPTPGVTEGGYMFKGGDPANKANWVKASTVLGVNQ